ncbi:MAG TPA: sulfotransferase family 2 domain-containing protein [Bryobacteraceae bacterium]|jgi:hypothetical protein|nr:sulfotransferase family 2 domain-containing protein [Bryobacteraceae bacterium]
MSLIGVVDALWDTCVSGWAADDDSFEKTIAVDVLVNALLVATVPCVTFRKDLRAAGIGDGCKGFRFDPSAHLKPGRNSLEVRYASGGAVVLRGQGQWVKRRAGEISDGEGDFLAALECYYVFRPEDHVCGIGSGARDLGRVLGAARVPFRKFTGLDVPSDPADIRLDEKADLVVSWAWSEPTLEAVRILRGIVQSQLNTAGFVAIGFTETAGVYKQIRQAFGELGAPDVKLESIAREPNSARRLFAFAATGQAEAAAAEATPVLAHIHVPKCAGTSFRVMQERYFGARHVGLYTDDTYFVYATEVLRGYLLQYPEMQGFSSHHVRRFPEWLGGRRILYITFLRDPVQQFVSYMTHIQKHYASIGSPSLREVVPPDAPRRTLREFARWLVTHDQDIPFRENYTVNFFTRHNAPGTADRLEAAKATLDQFFFVGISERMEESVGKLRELLRAEGLEFPPGPVPIENTSAECRDDLSWINPEDEVGSLLLRSLELDRQLYDWAVARLCAAQDVYVPQDGGSGDPPQD